MSDTQLHQNHVNKCSSFSKSGGLTDIFSAKYDFLLLLLIYKYKSLR